MLKDALDSVFEHAISGHRYVPDKTQYGLTEKWRASLLGDCEDFALWCREELARQDITSNLIMCRTETDELHLVLSAEGWILDNRQPWVAPRDDLPYEWIAVGEPDGTWFDIEK